MAVILGRAYPELFAAIGVHSGLPYGAAHDLPSAFAAMHQRDTSGPTIAHRENPRAWRGGIPTIVFHGDRDTTVHPCNGEKVVRQSAGVSAFNAGDNSIAAAADRGTPAGGTPVGQSYIPKVFQNVT